MPGNSAQLRRPRSGTAIRAIYDALYRGELVTLGFHAAPLRDKYGVVCEASNKGSRLLGQFAGSRFYHFTPPATAKE